MNTYTITKDLLPLFESKLSKFSKKFDKYGNYTYNVLNTYVCEDKNDHRYGHVLVDVCVDASYKVGDYSFVASLEWIDDVGENLIKKASEDVFVPHEYKFRRVCDHCKTNRNRKYTIILKNNKSDEYIQVGKSCVRDYIGVDLGNYMSYLSFFEDIEDFISSQLTSSMYNNNSQRLYTVDEILFQTVEDVKRHGYISKSLSIERDCDSTSTKVYLALIGAISIDSGEVIYKKYSPSKNDDSMQLVEDVKNFYLHPEDEYKTFLCNSGNSSNDYISNIQTILQTTWVEADKIGLVVSSVGTKLRIENEKKEKESLPQSNYVGEIGERLTIHNVTPVCVFSSYGAYGDVYIYKFIDNDGNVFVWKTSKALIEEEDNIKLDVTGTVKSHSMFRGIKQTEITRAKTKLVL